MSETVLTEGQTFGPVERHVDRATLVCYAGASTDFNPIHWDDAAARRAGMDGVIAHGMWTMGAALAVATTWIGDPRRIRSQRARFTRPVPVPPEGTSIEVSGTVSKVDGGTATLTLDVRHDGQAVLGRVEVLVGQEGR